MRSLGAATDGRYQEPGRARPTASVEFLRFVPVEATGWSNDRLRAVLLHELAHVQRFDCLTQGMAQIARAVHWFNPVAWMAVRELRREQIVMEQLIGSVSDAVITIGDDLAEARRSSTRVR